ncbi:MAG TPA: addiction module protein, partial [Thermoanaerobaculia bacterium]|nr:addiction module protein [Thermoanaerobaculia bacterium]
LELPEADRGELAGLLLRSLDPPPDPDVEAAWDAVIDRRMREIDEGTVQTIPWEQVRAEMNARIGKKP